MTLSALKWRGVAMLAAVVEPEETEGENAVDDGDELRFADADDGFRSGARSRRPRT